MAVSTKRLLISDETQNANGFVLETAGVRLAVYQSNPVLLWAHSANGMPIGRLTDIKVEGNRITALPDFDDDDPIAVLAQSKYEKGYLKGTSVGFLPHAAVVSEDDTKAPRVIDWTLLELSLVPVPNNPNGLQLSYHVTEASANAVTQQLAALATLPNPQQPTMKGIATQLGLADTATEQDIIAAVDGLQNQLSLRQVDTLVQDAKAKGHFMDEASEASFRTLAAGNISQAAAFVHTLSAVPTAVSELTAAPVAAPAPATFMSKLSAAQSAGATNADDRSTWTYLQWSQKDPAGLLDIKRNKPEEYKALAAEYVKAQRNPNR